MIRQYIKKIIAVISIFLVIFLVSCVQEKKKDADEYIIGTSEEDRIQYEADGLLAKDDIQGAFNLYKEAYNKYQIKKTFADRYVKTVETVKNRADRAFETEELPLAESLYIILLRNFNDFQSFSDMLSFGKGFLNTRIITCRAAIARKEVQQAFRAKRFQKIITTYRNLYAQYPRNRLVLKDYVKALKEMQSIGEKATAMKDYVVACKSYTVLVKNYSYFERFSQQLPFDRESLQERIRECKSLLFTKGLDEYRNGHLQDAISTWQSLLVFVPDDKDTKQALETAVVQMKRIQQKR
jgi:tetratricopeptide (TPR) repeat protein